MTMAHPAPLAFSLSDSSFGSGTGNGSFRAIMIAIAAQRL
jgi:hypothetical protein